MKRFINQLSKKAQYRNSIRPTINQYKIQSHKIVTPEILKLNTNTTKSYHNTFNLKSIENGNKTENTVVLGGTECSFELSRETGIGVMTMQREKAKNALGKQMIAEMTEILTDPILLDECRVLVIRSTVGGVFCAGADLKERKQMSQSEATHFVNKLRATFNAVEKLPMPTIALIEGAAFGGGLELALACDLRVASTKAKMGLVETGLAIIPGAGGTQRLPRLIGESRAKELIYTGRRLSAEEAKSYDIINKLATEEEAWEETMNLVNQMSKNGPIAMRMAKIAISQGMQMDISSGMALEQQCYAQVIPTKDRLEGIQAFLEKRKPVYKGE
mmetsp:Transcript_3556/g.5232  ORF Transcript_3556/g.5232 Transcript_3556/m.5232 type:complete len:331 (-) Transcript_3556:40-1032(-)